MKDRLENKRRTTWLVYSMYITEEIEPFTLFSFAHNRTIKKSKSMASLSVRGVRFHKKKTKYIRKWHFTREPCNQSEKSFMLTLTGVISNVNVSLFFWGIALRARSIVHFEIYLESKWYKKMATTDPCYQLNGTTYSHGHYC